MKKLRLDEKVVMEFQEIPSHLKMKCLNEVKKQVPFNLATFTALSYRKIYRIIKNFKKNHLLD